MRRTVFRALASCLLATVLLAGGTAAAQPGRPSFGQYFGSPGATGPNYLYPAPGVYGGRVFNPFGDPSIPPGVTRSPAYRLVRPETSAARFTVRLRADARLWIDGQATKQTGPERLFVTPPVLKLGVAYTYRLVAEWEDGGRSVRREREVEVRADGAYRINLFGA